MTEQNNPLSTVFLHPVKAMALQEGEQGLELHAVDAYVSWAWGMGGIVGPH